MCGVVKLCVGLACLSLFVAGWPSLLLVAVWDCCCLLCLFFCIAFAGCCLLTNVTCVLLLWLFVLFVVVV